MDDPLPSTQGIPLYGGGGSAWRRTTVWVVSRTSAYHRTPPLNPGGIAYRRFYEFPTSGLFRVIQNIPLESDGQNLEANDPLGCLAHLGLGLLRALHLLCRQAAPEATQGKMHSFFSQLPYKCHLEDVASVGD